MSESFITEMINGFPNSANSDDTEAAAKITIVKQGTNEDKFGMKFISILKIQKILY